MKSLRGLHAVLVFAMCIAALPVQAAKVQLDPPYKEFLNGPTSLLITRDETDVFQKLATNVERDRFIERFWEVRNPTPGTGNNAFKEEFYRRVAYAKSYYGRDAGTLGWKTDRGRTYILFGKPETTMSYHGNQEIYPTELWFYSNPGLSELPSFFYVLFFEDNGIGGYRVYRPYVDGPEKLLKSGGASKVQAYKYLHGISAELAAATLSYVPGEPLDLETYSGSMHSMIIPNAIQGYKEMPSYISTIRARSARLERVTSRVDYNLATSELTTMVVRQQGRSWLHWRVEVRDAVAKWSAGPVNLDVTSKIYVKGRLVYEQEDHPTFALDDATAARMAARPLAYTDMVPVEPGTYQLNVEIRNRMTHTVYEAADEVEVKDPTDKTVVSEVLVISKYGKELRSRPFQFGGVQFEPSPGKFVTASRGLPLLYQLQLPASRPAKLIAHYAIAEVTSKSKLVFDEPVDLAGADATGAMMISRTLPVSELGPGRYRLSIRLEDPVTKKETATALSFSIATEPQDKNPIVIARAQSDSPQRQASVDYQRALCLLAQDKPKEAVPFLHASLAANENPAVKTLLDHLKSTPTAPTSVRKENN